MAMKATGKKNMATKAKKSTAVLEPETQETTNLSNVTEAPPKTPLYNPNMEPNEDNDDDVEIIETDDDDESNEEIDESDEEIDEIDEEAHYEKLLEITASDVIPSEISFLTKENCKFFQYNPYNPRNLEQSKIKFCVNMEFDEKGNSIPYYSYELADEVECSKEYREKFNELLQSLISISKKGDSLEIEINVINPLRVCTGVENNRFTVLSGNTRLSIIRQVLTRHYNVTNLNVPVNLVTVNGVNDLLSVALIDNTGIPLDKTAHWAILDNARIAAQRIMGNSPIEEIVNWIKVNLCYAPGSTPIGTKRIPQASLSKWKVSIEYPMAYKELSEYLNRNFISRFIGFVQVYGKIEDNLFRAHITNLCGLYLESIKKKEISSEKFYKGLTEYIAESFNPNSKSDDDKDEEIDEIVVDDEETDEDANAEPDKKLMDKFDLALGRMPFIGREINFITSHNAEDFKDVKISLKLIKKIEELTKQLSSQLPVSTDN